MLDLHTGIVVPVIYGPNLSYNWSVSPDFKHILIKRFTHNEIVGNLTEDILGYEDWYLASIPTPANAPRENYLTQENRDTFGHVVKPVLSNVVDSSGIWTPDGTGYIFTTSTLFSDGTIHMSNPRVPYDVKLFHVRTGVATIVARTSPQQPIAYRSFHWDPSGHTLLALGGDAHLYGAARQETLWSIPFTGAPKKLVTPLPHGVGFSGWVVSSAISDRAVAYSGQAQTILLQTFDPDTYDEGFASVNLRTGAVKQLYRESVAHRDDWTRGGLLQRAYPYSPKRADAIAANHSHVVYWAQSYTQPGDLWTLSMTPLQRHRLTNLNPTIARSRNAQQLLTWRTASGKAHGILLLPPGASRRHPFPLIVDMYPGAAISLRLSIWGGINQWSTNGTPVPNDFTQHGFAVLLPDMVFARTGDARVQTVATVLPALDAAIATGLVDRKRTGIFGHSYGGQAVNEIVTGTHRFAAAVAASAVSDFISGYLNHPSTMDSIDAPGAFTNQMNMGGTLWQVPQNYIRSSPVFYLNQVETPLLLIHGDQDGTVPYFHAQEMYNGLNHLGKVVELATYHGMGHGPYGPNKDVQDNDIRKRVLAWFTHYLHPSQP